MRRRKNHHSVADKVRGLPIKERVFVLKFLETLDVREAAQSAGYSPNYGYALLEKERVEQAVSSLLDERVMSAEEALARLSEMARADIRDVVSLLPRRDADGNIIYKESGEPDVEAVIDIQKAMDEGRSFLIKEAGQTHEGSLRTAAAVAIFGAAAAAVFGVYVAMMLANSGAD